MSSSLEWSLEGYLNIIAVFVIALSFYFLGSYIAENAGKLSESAYIPSACVVSAALIITLLGHLWNSWLWWYSLQKINTPTYIADAYRSWAVSRLARYVPGKVFSYFIRARLHGKQQRSGVNAGSIVEILGGTLATLIVAVLATVFYREKIPANIVYVLYLLLPLSVFSLFLMARFANILMMKVTGDRVGAADLTLYFPTLVKLALLQIPLMCIHGAAFFIILSDATGVEWYWFLYTVAVYYLSGLLGQLAIFSPAGLGVREAGLLAMLSPLVGESLVLLYVVILIRCVLVASEVINAFCAHIVYRFSITDRVDPK